ncbi:unnamed protein product [Caenorhabditis angaria]|uniref:Fibronectin type-III domain-containing protein n=1 Tax=Caenorhabditis angaria TaxID=860376 RepID=A0A9P1N9I7_9PELO|nr:unnamed protein product [Caenorhabditis angaria]
MDEEEKENFDERADTSLSNSTFNTTTSSQRVENQEAEIDEWGFLDLKNLQLTHLSKNLISEYAKCRTLDISQNEFRYFNYFEFFKKLEVLNASDNMMQKFQAIHHVKLRELNLSNNQLKSITGINRFENLTKLDVSCNSLEQDFALNFPNLLHLDLFGNSLTKIPDLSKCEKLQFLHLSANKIETLHNISSLISLEILDISSNNIIDLSEFSNLTHLKNLEFLYTSNNPCITSTLAFFDPRIYLIAVCGEKLEQIDGLDIEDEVRTNGEWLSIQGQVRRIQPGNHEELCEKIAKHFPAEELEAPLTPAQLTCKKVLKKRRESESQQTSERTSGSAYSPFREWNGKMDKLNESIEKINLKSSTPKRITMEDVAHAKEQRANSSMRICSPNRRKSTDPPMYQWNQEKHLQRTDSTDSTLTVVLSSARVDPTPTPIMDSEKSNRIPSVAEVIEESPRKNSELEQRVRALEEQMREMAKQNQNLTKMNEELTDFFMNFIKSQTPTPKNLSMKLLKESNDTYVVKWDLPIVQGYEIWIDGKSCGKVVGKNNTARITDLDEYKEHTVQVRAISTSGNLGELSEVLKIPASKN